MDIGSSFLLIPTVNTFMKQNCRIRTILLCELAITTAMYIADVVGCRTSYQLLYIAHVNTNMLGKRLF